MIKKLLNISSRVSASVLFISLFFSTAGWAQPDSIVAKIGNLNITSSEFRNRFELTPQIYHKGEDFGAQKKDDLLYSLIAEKLWAQDAERLGLDSTYIMQTTYKAMEDMFVRDALYNIEIKSKINVSEPELLEGMKKHFTTLKVDAIYSKDSSEIISYYKALKKGASFDSLQLATGVMVPTVDVNFGDMKENIENEIYKLKIGEITPPVVTSSGWVIFKLKDRIKKSYTKEDVNSSMKKVDEMIRDRKEKHLFQKYYDKFFKSMHITTNGDLFWSLADKITAIAKKKRASGAVADSQDVKIDAKDILSIERQFGSDTLKMVFIRFTKNPFSLRRFLRYFIFEGFTTRETDEKIIAAKLNYRVRRTIEQELLAREGYKRGLENLPQVENQIAMWKSNYLANMLKDKLLDSVKVNDDEVYNYYEKLNKEKDTGQEEVNILEVLTDSLDVVEKVLNDLDNGADFRQLASIHTKRTWTKNKGGEFGYFPVNRYGDIGKIAAKMKVGDVYGPLKTPEGYSVFKLIGKKSKKEEAPVSFDKEKEKLRLELKAKKLDDYFIKYTVKLANKYGVKINKAVYQKISVPDLQMFVYRYMGFGGRIAAVPLTIPFTEWYKPWLNSQKAVP